MRTLLERFESKFIPEPNSGCWLWTGVAWDRRIGYGKITIKSKVHKAHRVAWQLYRGLIPARFHVLHKCDNNYCVNPDHLYLGDQRQNNLDRDDRGRHVALRGSASGSAKLTDDQIYMIRSSDLSNVKIAPSFGVHHSTISRIRRHETWQNIA